MLRLMRSLLHWLVIRTLSVIMLWDMLLFLLLLLLLLLSLLLLALLLVGLVRAVALVME